MLSYSEMWDMPLASAAQRGVEPEEGERHIPHWFANIVFVVVFVALEVAFRMTSIGKQNLRALHGKGAVLVSAHQSYLDPAFLWINARPKQWIRFMARDNMFGNANGLAGQAISRVGAFPIKRDSADRSAIKRAAAMLKRSELVGIFPEGTRRGRGTAEIALHNGAAFIARMGKAPMLPCAIRGVANIKRKEYKFIHFPKVTVVYGTPVWIEEFDFLPKSDRLDAASWYVMRECYALLRDVPAEQIDMHELFPEARDFSAELADFKPRGIEAA